MADNIKQEFYDQVMHALACFAVVVLLRIAIPPWWGFVVAMFIMVARECIQHRSHRLGFGSALDIFCGALGATIGVLI